MSSTVVVATVLAASLLEGTWGWLFVATISEVVGQAHPSRAGVALLLLGAWVAARLLAAAAIDLHRRRQILVGAGLLLATTAATIQAGVLTPLHLFMGEHSPDHRAAGIFLFILVAYLWARGLWLAVHVTRRRLVNHLVTTACALILILVFLPLADVVREEGLGAVVFSFMIAIAALMMTRVTEAESHHLTRTQWTAVSAGIAVLLSAGAGLLTGLFSGGTLDVFGRGVGAFGRAVSPVTDSILLGLGLVAQGLVEVIRWVSALTGVDGEATLRTMREAAQSRLQFDELTPDQGAPDVLAVPVVAITTLVVIGGIVLILARMVRASRQRDGGVLARRDRVDSRDEGVAGLLRKALHGLFAIGADTDDLGTTDRAAIRRSYRAFQQLMATANILRGVGQTPAEFEATVAQELPGAEKALSALTQAYAAARYADERTPIAKPRDVARSLDLIRDALRGRIASLRSG